MGDSADLSTITPHKALGTLMFSVCGLGYSIHEDVIMAHNINE
ncbi:MAG: hypothetical protein OXD44_03680 [Gammaproteobacteria bacterium]|nr:hypothetical protein [Gammaproteobacteria bacterium]